MSCHRKCASGPGHPAETSSAGEPQKGYRLFFLMSLISERRFSISLKVEPENLLESDEGAQAHGKISARAIAFSIFLDKTAFPCSF
jgi:hypothetical protein